MDAIVNLDPPKDLHHEQHLKDYYELGARRAICGLLYDALVRYGKHDADCTPGHCFCGLEVMLSTTRDGEARILAKQAEVK